MHRVRSRSWPPGAVGTRSRSPTSTTRRPAPASASSHLPLEVPPMPRTPAFVLPALACAAAAPAQTGTLTAPAAAASRDGLGVLEVAGFTRTMRQQFLLGPSHLSGARGMELVALRFRRDGHVVEHNPGAAQVVVRLSASSALDPARPDPRFDANHHVPPVTVFQGVVTLPRSPALAHRDA